MAFVKNNTQKKYTEFEIVKSIGTLSEWKNEVKNIENFKEINEISWGKRNPVIDIRSWWIDDNGNKRPGKGITFNKEEIYKLYKLLESEGYNKEPDSNKVNNEVSNE